MNKSGFNSPASILPIFLDIHNYANELINMDNVEIRVKVIRKKNLTIISMICFIDWVCTVMQNCTESNTCISKIWHK